MKLLWLTCLLACGFSIEIDPKNICINKYVEGYYWREYTGDIPSDALPGGVDAEGNPTYIGQVLFYNNTGMILPGQINAETKTISFEHYGPHTATKAIKILCTQHPESFQWIKTRNGEDTSNVLEDNMSFITGGNSEYFFLCTIGRISVGNQVIIGKVNQEDQHTVGLFHAAVDGKQWSENSFEMLVYNPSISKDQEGCGRIININIF